MNHPIFKIVPKRFPHEGRCVHCDARNYCGIPTQLKFRMICECKISEHYININKERKQKLQKLTQHD